MHLQKPPHNILIVDDTPHSIKYMADLLRHEGYEVDTAQSGKEALQSIKNSLPELIILDVIMPGISGYEVCQQIRENPDTALLPVIMITALDPASEKIKGIEVGADDFLSKPLNHAELLARVRALLRTKVLHDTIHEQARRLETQNKLLSIQIEKSERIIRDLHDDVGAKLLTLVHGAKEASDQQTAREALQTLREIIYCIEKGNVTRYLYDVMADWRAELMERLDASDTQLDWHVDNTIENMVLDSVQHVNISRILREGFSNAIKHALPDLISVSIYREDLKLVIEICNNGVCSDPGGWHDGAGVNNMRRRANEINAAISWLATPSNNMGYDRICVRLMFPFG